MSDELWELLDELHSYFDSRSDVIDGDYGVPEPNYAMVLADRISKFLETADIEGTR